MPVNNKVLPYAQSFYETTLSNAITATQTSIIVATAPANQTGYLVIEPNSTNREIVYFSAVSGNTLTVVRGISETNTVDDTGTGTGSAHAAGVQVAMKDVHYYFNKIVAAYRGDNASGFNTFSIGDGNALSAANRLWKANTTTVSAFWGLSSNGKMVVSEDGVTSYVISAGGSGVAAGNGISIIGGTVSINSLSTGGLGLSGNAAVVTLSGSLINRNSAGIYFDPSQPVYPSSTWDFGGDFRINGTKLSAGISAINQALNNISASVTAANLGTLTSFSDASQLHYHTNLTGYTAGWFSDVVPFGAGWLGAATSTYGNFVTYSQFSTGAMTLYTHTIPYYRFDNGIQFSNLSALNRIMSMEFSLNAINSVSAFSTGFFGIGLVDGQNNSTAYKYNADVPASSGAGIWLGVTSGGIYAVASNTTSKSVTKLSASVTDLSNMMVFRIDYVSGLSSNYYLNGTLIHTNTSAIPKTSSNESYIGFGGLIPTNGVNVGSVYFREELY